MSDQKQNSNKKEEIGAFWKKKSQAGNVYLSGYFLDEKGERVSVVVFQNTYKQPGEKSPDYRAYKSDVQGEGGQAAPKAKAAAPVSEPSTAPDDDDIPF
jgi:uncharacterized protein (DUF736 family)